METLQNTSWKRKVGNVKKLSWKREKKTSGISNLVKIGKGGKRSWKREKTVLARENGVGNVKNGALNNLETSKNGGPKKWKRFKNVPETSWKRTIGNVRKRVGIGAGSVAKKQAGNVNLET